MILRGLKLQMAIQLVAEETLTESGIAARLDVRQDFSCFLRRAVLHISRPSSSF